MSTTLPFEQQPVNLYASGVDGDGTFLDFIAVIDDCQTIRFKRGWYQPGDFELTINKNTNYAPLFQRKRIIQIGNDVTKCGVIESVVNQVGPTGALSELITIKGRELTSYLDRRIVAPPSGQAYYSLPSTTPVETVIKTIVNASMGPGASANRQVAQLTIQTDTAGGDAYVLSARYDNLLLLVGNACLATSSGVFAYLDHANKKWVLGWSAGINRTAGQSVNQRAIFSTDRETVLTAKLTDVDTGFKNFAAVGGQGEGAARTVVTVPTVEPTGIDRREMFVDARDLTTVPALTNRGLQKLSENQFVKFLESDVLAFSQLIYGQDYNIGDEVTIQQFGQSQDQFITSAEEYWAANTYNLKIGFDKSSPTLPGQVAQALSQVQKTLNSTEFVNQQAVMMEYQPVISADYTISSKRNGVSFTPVTVDPGVTVTIPVGYEWRVRP